MSCFEPKVRWWSATTRSLSRFAPVRRPHARRRLRLECLEDRTVLSTIALSVNTLVDDPSGPTSGSTTLTLRDAITQADADLADSYVINFASGLQGTIDLTSALPDLCNNIALNGPGASDLTVQRLSRAPDFSVFTVDSGVTVSLSGVTITGGNAGSGNGGGIDNSGTVTVSNSAFYGNSASIGGGGIFNSGTATVTGSTFTGNYGGDGGGGIFNSGTATVTGSTFTGNSVSVDFYFVGGGICGIYGSVIVTNSTFTGNSASEGGGIYGGVIVTNSTFTGNSAYGGTGTGLVFGGYGGGISGSGMLTNCTVSGNTCQVFAGGPGVGGDGGGGGISGDLTLKNTIVAGNTSTETTYTGTETSENDIFGQVQPTSAFNLIGDGSGISNITALEAPALSNLIGTTADPLNPLLGSLANNGGPTQTMALLPGSPAIDAGCVALAVDPTTGQPLAYDQRGPGFPRILGHSVDIGADEFSPLNQTISFGPLAGQTYGVAPITLNATASSDLPVSFTVLSGPATVSGSVLTVNGAGNVVVEASQPGNATYSAAAPVDESFTVSPAPLTITPTAGQSMTYGGTVPALTYIYTGLVNGDNSATFSGGLATSATSSSSVGGYTITQGTLAATGNYTIGTFNAGTLTVNAAPLTIMPMPGQSMVYGGAVPALTYTASGFVNGDPGSLLTGALGTTATSTSAVGSYPFTLGSLTAGTNYALALATNPPTFAVTPDGTTTRLASSANPSSFGQAVTFTATVTANAPGSGSPTGTVTFYVGPVNPADQIGSTGTLSSSSGVMTASVSTSSLPVGTDTVTATYSGDGNFLTSTGTLTITINQSIIVLDPSAGGALSVSGYASINIPGVVYVDSGSSTALSGSGNAQVKAAVIDVHGKVQKSGNASFSPAPVTGAPILANPLASLALPSTSGLTNYVSESLSGNSSATIQPGIYKQITVSGNAKLTLSSGIYIIEGGGFSVSVNASVSGSGVMIVNAGSKYPNTGGTYGSIVLSGNGSYNLSPLSTGSYAGIVIFQPGDNTNVLSVSGNASGITGAIYAPAAQLAESGNAQLNAALVVDTLTISGNGIADGAATLTSTIVAGQTAGSDISGAVSGSNNLIGISGSGALNRRGRRQHRRHGQHE